MAEWLIARLLKSREPERVPGVRISLFPLYVLLRIINPNQKFGFFYSIIFIIFVHIKRKR